MRKGKNMSLLGKELKEGLTELESVGCCIDTKLGITYPMYVDGTYDEDGECHLEDTCEEWFDALSVEDTKIVDDCMLELGIA
jgi:hypothetical protein